MFILVTVNANGLRAHNKLMSFLQWLSHLSADFVYLQETHVSSCTEAVSWFSSYGFLALTSPWSLHLCGSVLHYRPTFILAKSSTDRNGHFVLAHFTRDDLIFGVVCLYAPNRNPDRNAFLDFCPDQVDPSVPTVLCGDFNTVFDGHLDRRGSAFDSSRKSSVALGNLFHILSVSDVCRFKHPDSRVFTWLRPDGSCSSRIDLIGCPSSWLHLVDSCEILPCPLSDHSAVMLQCVVPVPFPRGPGRWILNTSILSDAGFVPSFHVFWRFWKLKKNAFSSLSDWWDRGKERIKGIAIEFCNSKSKEKRVSRSLLSTLASHLKFKIDAGQVSLLSVYQNVLAKLAALDLVDAQGAKMRSRIKWAEEGESSSRYFLNLEKRRGAADWISAMKSSDGMVLTSIGDICDSWSDFYSSLFTACTVDSVAQTDLLSNVSSSLTAEQSFFFFFFFL